ncbi:aromatic ring-hydroxylating oxygenase subunit alpha [Paludibacterium yongneupense]|uniref:aromatic ring-hydroxylating oxygenase subunit alpha n=1 Tax=Paludibacterium yongneupense TaxID=400061 RepID=UPI000413B527|nr:aromatic ring-hydroxylating dioxygenase subunit alpha [Paludibacterium yongneupense]
MSDLAFPVSSAAAATQLPIASYFDPLCFDEEQRLLFERAPRYYGHRLMVPNEGDYHTLEWLGHGKMLKRAGDDVLLLSNVCRHRQATIYQGRGNGNTIVCNLHGWTYDKQGQLLGAPHFPETPCLALERTELVDWNGLLFDARRDVARDLGRLGVARHIDFSDYAYHSTQSTDYAFNWKTFIEVYSEDYHVDPFHPGLGQFVDCGDLRWEWGEFYHVQTVGVKSRLAQPGSRVYGEWHAEVLRRFGERMPDFGAIWLSYYPNVMVECYPHALVISVVIPRTVESCTVVTEFYYPEEVVYFEPEFVAAEQAAYFETAREDDEICLRMHQGRKALWQAGRSETGPYQSPTEDGMRHFHDYYRREMGLPR